MNTITMNIMTNYKPLTKHQNKQENNMTTYYVMPSGIQEMDKVPVRDSITIEKPTVLDLINEAIKMKESVEQLPAEVSHNWREKCTGPLNKMFDQNEAYLSLMKPKNYSQVNFNRLIASIELNGEQNFNMTVFMGMVDRESLEDSYDKAYLPVTNRIGSDYITFVSEENPFYKATKTFNCNTVGCIAGFATAIAVDWEEELWKKAMLGSVIESNKMFEHIASNFLNIPLQLGKSIFFSGNNTIWSFLKSLSDSTPSLSMFKSLRYEGYDEDDYWDDEDENEEDKTVVDLSSITSAMAVTALTMVKEGILHVGPNGVVYMQESL